MDRIEFLAFLTERSCWRLGYKSYS